MKYKPGWVYKFPMTGEDRFMVCYEETGMAITIGNIGSKPHTANIRDYSGVEECFSLLGEDVQLKLRAKFPVKY